MSPPRWVGPKVKDLIFYYYARSVIAPAAGFAGNFGFIYKKYKALLEGSILFSDFEEDIEELSPSDNNCIICNKQGNVRFRHLVRLEEGGPFGIHNIFPFCISCFPIRYDGNFLEYWVSKRKRNIDDLPRSLLSINLKLLYYIKKVNFELDDDCSCFEDLI